MLPFIVGSIVGASVVALLFIVFAPSRKVRAEQPLDRDVETKLLLGLNPEDATVPPYVPTDDPDRPYSSQDLAQLRRLGEANRRRR